MSDPSVKEILARIDERVSHIWDKIENLEEDFVHKHEFEPIKKAVYGVVALILTTVILAVVGLVIKTAV